MLKSIKNLDHGRIIASDGQVGTVRDVYFDDKRWVIRYLVVETGSWLNARRVLISPYAVRFIDWQTRAVVVNLSRDQVQRSPGIDTDKPVSRQQEEEFHRYYGYPQYWPYSTLWAWGEIPLIHRPDFRGPEADESAGLRERASADVHLRSSGVVAGYRIQATDAFHGQVEDFLFDEETWAIRYLIANTRIWLPGKHVLVAQEFIREVDWSEQAVALTLTRHELANRPVYDPQHPPSTEAAKALGGRESRKTS